MQLNELAELAFSCTVAVNPRRSQISLLPTLKLLPVLTWNAATPPTPGRLIVLPVVLVNGFG